MRCLFVMFLLQVLCECFVVQCFVMLCFIVLFCYAEVCFVVAGHVTIPYVFFLLCFVLLLFCYVVFYNMCYVFRHGLLSRWCVLCCSVSFFCMLLRFVVLTCVLLLCFHLLCFVSSLFSTVSPQVSAYIKLWMSSVHVQRSLVKLQSVPRNFALSELPTCV